MSAAAVPAVPTRPAVAPGSPVPCTVPRRAVRVDRSPEPTLRPLAEVLAEQRARWRPDDPTATAGDAGEDTGAGRSRTAEGRAAVSGVDDLEQLAAAARPVAARVLGAIAEILDGVRPPMHLRAVCDEKVFAEVLTTLAAARGRPAGTGRSRVGGVRVCAVGAGAVESAGVIRRGPRARAVAARLEKGPAGWRLHALEVG